MFKIRRSRDRLIFNMEIPIPGKDSLYIETGPRSSSLQKCGLMYCMHKPYDVWHHNIDMICSTSINPHHYITGHYIQVMNINIQILKRDLNQSRQSQITWQLSLWCHVLSLRGGHCMFTELVIMVFMKQCQLDRSRLTPFWEYPSCLKYHLKKISKESIQDCMYCRADIRCDIF